MSATLRNFDNFSFEGMTNVFRFARKLFLAMGSNSKLQRELVQQLLGPTTDRAGLIRRSSLTKSRKVWEASADFFRHLLNTKVKLIKSVICKELKPKCYEFTRNYTLHKCQKTRFVQKLKFLLNPVF